VQLPQLQQSFHPALYVLLTARGLRPVDSSDLSQTASAYFSGGRWILHCEWSPAWARYGTATAFQQVAAGALIPKANGMHRP